MVEVQFDLKVRKIRTDNGGEFVNKEVNDVLKENGILHQRTCPYTPQQNGVVERKHRSILEVARSLVFQSKLQENLWPYSLLAAVQIINTFPSEKLGWKSPFELLHGRTPAYNLFRTFGCLCYANKNTPYRKKFDARAVACVFLGFVTGVKGYRVYDLEGRHVFVSRDVIFYEDQFPFSEEFQKTENVVHNIPLPVVTEDLSSEEEDSVDSSDVDPIAQHTENSHVQLPEVVEDIRKGTRERRAPGWMADYVVNHLTEEVQKHEELSLFFTKIDKGISEPMFYEQAAKDTRWVAAMHKELQALEANETCDHAPGPCAHPMLIITVVCPTFGVVRVTGVSIMGAHYTSFGWALVHIRNSKTSFSTGGGGFLKLQEESWW
ncbi:Uncharacterized mitochondrial protein AtMg00710 [Striga hermonthica]|uniref:Uncharacterized mitochondrial protein AtMg00710 n=1 Tax=Striga hermonthica TaxID=68872 RepID=A0A9N7MHM5_STRHE|nr:Uncharacterized mitochondrial protein AtMg00710 [Striga hermonthica]